MIKQTIEHISNQTAHAAVPVSYVASFGMLSDPLRFGGFGLIVIQGVYWSFKLYDFLKERNVKKQSNASDRSGTTS